MGRPNFARCMVEVDAVNPPKEKLVVAVPRLEDEGYSKETITVEYEWRPPRCDKCKIFDHITEKCPLNVEPKQSN